MQKFLISAFALLPTTASAHIGDHTHIELSAMLAHLLEADHLALIGLVLGIAYCTFRHLKASNKADAVQKDYHT